jgi:hypothetical protein
MWLLRQLKVPLADNWCRYLKTLGLLSPPVRIVCGSDKAHVLIVNFVLQLLFTTLNPH